MFDFLIWFFFHLLSMPANICNPLINSKFREFFLIYSIVHLQEICSFPFHIQGHNQPFGKLIHSLLFRHGYWTFSICGALWWCMERKRGRQGSTRKGAMHKDYSWLFLLNALPCCTVQLWVGNARAEKRKSFWAKAKMLKTSRKKNRKKNTLPQPNEVYLAALLHSAGVEFSTIVM